MANVLSKEKIVGSSKFVVKFLIGTAISYGINIILTFFLTELVSIPYIISYCITQVVQISFSFSYNSKILFKSGVSKWIFAKFLIVLFTTAIMNILTVKLLTDYFAVYYLLSISLSLAFYTIIKYTIYNFYVFKKAN